MRIVHDTLTTLKAFAVGTRLLLRPKGELDALLTFGNIIAGTPAAKRAFDIVAQDEDARRLIEERYSRDLLRPEALAECPEGSLGHALRRQLIDLGLDTYPLQLSQDCSAHEYVRERRREIHDLLHVVLDYDTTYVGEASLNAFLAAHGHMPICVMIPIGIALRHLFTAPEDLPPLLAAIANAYRRGQACPSPFGVRWEERLDQPLEDARAMVAPSITGRASIRWLS